MNRIISCLLLLAIVLPVLAEENNQEGQALFEANCMACHQKEGAGLAGLAPSIGNRDFLAIASDKFIERVVLEGRPGTSMIPRSDLKGDKLKKIIKYLRAIPVALPISIKVDDTLKFKGDSAKGKTLFRDFCSSCHGPKGEGYVITGPGPGIGLSGFLNQASDDFILKTLEHGRSGTAMRSFIGAKGLGNLTVLDAKDIIVYLRTLGGTPVKAVSSHPGAQQYMLCVSCHGVNAEGNPLLKAPRLAGFTEAYIITQLKKFKAGARGYHEKDINGITMKNMANLIKDEAAMKSIASYIKTLKSPLPTKTVAGDVGKGQIAYATCMACHGPNGEGNPVLKSPPILGLNDWYIVEQLKKFKSGQRGTHANDPEGAMMRPMSMIIPNEQAMKDLALYIHSLSNKEK
jgi:cytochrome c553